tara:strand:+ start:159 stop:539 length:381 start_codon:yes stop_codon:yes gene_type:complete
MEIHNSMVDMMKNMHETYSGLIKKVCQELGQEEKTEEMIEKLLDTKLHKIKKLKDPNAPKKAKSAFMLFCDKYRPILQKENPGEKMGGIAKLLGQKWKVISDEEKETFMNLNEDEKQRFKNEMEDY